MKFVCQKQFNEKGNYTKEDIKIFNSSITDGIEELKTDWKGEEYNGIYLTENNDNLIIEIKENEITPENDYSNKEYIERCIKAVISNYCIPFSIVN